MFCLPPGPEGCVPKAKFRLVSTYSDINNTPGELTLLKSTSSYFWTGFTYRLLEILTKIVYRRIRTSYDLKTSKTPNQPLSQYSKALKIKALFSMQLLTTNSINPIHPEKPSNASQSICNQILINSQWSAPNKGYQPKDTNYLPPYSC